MVKKLTGQGLRAYRSNLAKAKRLGVVKSSIDARSHKPTKYMQSKLKKLEGVLSGRVAAVKAKPSVVREFKQAGARVVNNRILIEQRPGVKTTIRKGELTEGVIYQRRQLDGGYFEEEITLPVSFQIVGDMLEWLREHSAQMQSKKNSGDLWGFKIEGNRSRATFGNMEALYEYLTFYANIGTIQDVDLGEHPEFLTIWRVKHPDFLRQKRAGDFRKRRIRTVQDRREGQERPAFYREKKPTLSQAERNKRYREKHSEVYKEKAKARAAKSRAKRKGK